LQLDDLITEGNAEWLTEQRFAFRVFYDEQVVGKMKKMYGSSDQFSSCMAS